MVDPFTLSSIVQVFRQRSRYVAKINKKGVSRRDFLFGGLRRVREEIVPEPKGDVQTMAQAAPTVSKDDAAKAKEAFAKASAAFSRGDFEGAVPLFRQCLKHFPAHVEARKRLGYCHYRLGGFVQSRVEFEHVLHDKGKDNFSSLYLGLAYCRLNKPDKAAKAWGGYYNPDEVRIMRELNIQCALLDMVEPPDPAEVADEVEATIKARKEELLNANS